MYMYGESVCMRERERESESPYVKRVSKKERKKVRKCQEIDRDRETLTKFVDRRTERKRKTISLYLSYSVEN